MHVKSKNRKIWTKMTKSWPNPFHIFQWGSCQTVDILSSKTFWNSAISSFGKKWLFSNKKYFHISQTCKNDSAPPSLHLKIGPNFKARGGGSGVILACFVYMKVLFIFELPLFTEWRYLAEWPNCGKIFKFLPNSPYMFV